MMTLLLLTPIILYPILRAIYNLTLHPLARTPGPKLWAAFTFPFVYQVTKQNLPRKVNEFHDQYGPIVRISPNELSFTSAQGWRDIYGAKNPQNPKDLLSYLPPDEYEGKRMLMDTCDATHAALRAQISNAFSTKALLVHQPLINGYIDQLTNSIRLESAKGSALDVTAYFNWTTFDIAGHLTFGESFHCLDTLSYHPWIRVIFDGLSAGYFLNQLGRYGLLGIALKCIPKSIQKPRDDMMAYSNARMDERLRQGFGPGTRRDFAYFMANGPERNGEKAAASQTKPDRTLMCANGETLIIAGSETTATLLSGLTYLLLAKRPDFFDRLKLEVRSAFTNTSLEEMNFKSVTEKLPLTVAAIREALRFYPPVPAGLARRISNEPRIIDGILMPVGSSASVCQWAASHQKRNWYRPDEFLPERWLEGATRPGSVYEQDDRETSQPFSVGPRNCLGKTLAEVESRLVYAKLLFNFDLDLVPGQADWIEKQSVTLIWGKAPLMVRFRDIHR